MEKENYIDLVKEQIELDKLLAITNPEYHDEIKNLLAEKKKIMKENGFFAEYKIQKINKKIEKIKQEKK